MERSLALGRTAFAFAFALFALTACGQTKSASDAGNGGVPATVNEAFNACVLAEACGGGPWLPQWQSGGIDQCYRDVLESIALGADAAPPGFNGLTPQAFVACGASATSCASWFSCATPGHDPAYCAGHPQGSCDGNIAVNCASATVGGSVQSCPSGQFACRLENGNALCTDGTTCEEGDSEACVDNVATSCSAVAAGFQTGLDCLASTCVSGGAPGPTIAGCEMPSSDANCNASSVTVCQGDVASICAGFGDPFGGYTEDCAAIDAHCDASGPAGALFGYCYSNATDCPDGAAPSCSGTTYSACVNGRNATFDCATLGLSCSPNGCG